MVLEGSGGCVALCKELQMKTNAYTEEQVDSA